MIFSGSTPFSINMLITAEFIIGGPWGLDQQLRDSCREVIALSRMTFNHRMVRVFLLEQIYRAFQILKGGGYAGK